MLIIFISCKNEKNKSNPTVIQYEENGIAKISDDELYANIDFQDFFENDNTTLSINNCLIFKNKYLNSDKSVGLAEVFLKIKKEDSSLLIALNDSKVVRCATKDNGLFLNVLVNNAENSFMIDIKKGKYIGLEKNDYNRLVLNQSTSPFEYD